MTRIHWTILATMMALAGYGRAADAPTFKAGVATRAITPDGPMWMAGYGNRMRPADGAQHDLLVNALALEDAAGTVLVLVTSDLIGIPREFGEAVAAVVQKRAGISRDRLMLTASHTHCGPVLAGNLMDMYPVSAAQKEQISRYTDRLACTMVETILAALADRSPARLSFGSGTARFAVNRRQPSPRGGFVGGVNPDGPVDHTVPVLKVEGADGRLRAAVFGYACHNTTLQYYRWCGDYAGFAQRAVEAKYPGAVAMFWSGCGADANPNPRGKVEQAEHYGRQLAEAVDGVLTKATTPVTGRFAARFATIPLAFDHVPTRDQLQADLRDNNHTKRQRAERFLAMLDAGKALPTEYAHYPMQVWRLGNGPLWIGLGGEVVIDYAIRLKAELAGVRLAWVTAYANDVMAYIPSERVLKEGGYEGDTSMIPYGLPSKWKAGLEDRIVGEVRELVRELW